LKGIQKGVIKKEKSKKEVNTYRSPITIRIKKAIICTITCNKASITTGRNGYHWIRSWSWNLHNIIITMNDTKKTIIKVLQEVTIDIIIIIIILFTGIQVEAKAIK